MVRYRDVYDSWKSDPDEFWLKAARGIDWIEAPEKAFNPDAGVYGRWFDGGVCNTSYNCLDRHVEGGLGEETALIYDSPITGKKRIFSYNALLDEVATFAAVLKSQGVEKGDRVIVYMPMVPEAAIAMLACSRIGAIHSVVFGGFAPHELATRINDAQPKLIVSASCGIEPNRIIPYKPMLDSAIAQASHKPDGCIILQREEHLADEFGARDHDWSSLLSEARASGQKAEPEPMAATDPLYILYTSGTTGQPKGVVRDTGGHMVALKWSMDNVYDVKAGQTFWAASDVGWVVGHSYIVYAPLLQGCATIMFEGKPVGTPDAGVFWRVIEEHKVTALFTAPTAFRAIKKEDPNAELLGNYDTSSLKTLFLAGERADPDTIKWAETMLKVPVIDNWWQTETGWPITANPRGIELLSVKYGSSTVPMPGYEIHILDEGGHEVGSPSTLGAVCIKLPLPPGCLPTLWGNDNRFKSSYLTHFPGYYETSDAGMIDEDGYLHIMARTDDIINVAGHRLSTGGMEEVLSSHPAVAECAVLGAFCELKGQKPLGLIVLKSGVTQTPEEIEKECVALVRSEIGAVAALRNVMVVQRLPKTRSGKILRATIRKIADGEDFKMPATIDDPVILDEITDVLKAHDLISNAAVASA
ncbi:propionyl-CoA synthetase [Ponticaulis sp.]|uniref:propionyl-CoA synthetase n=1 Tax=Ponticaulis sp. TaxID=2020902 RepID=UPI000B6613BC|nr:propionyl-CoA synthetase [Ponticaulis sp.]MAI90034.1 propionyl-CoA synthetase [Ponticaulis sp.]OUX99694.1 MAG: propionyl-CoA synthetase [Hyphomonadaceae bacterium TMED5]